MDDVTVGHSHEATRPPRPSLDSLVDGSIPQPSSTEASRAGSHSPVDRRRGSQHRKTVSLTSPPPPPIDFNPPPDFTSDTLLHGIETPLPPSSTTTAANSTRTSPAVSSPTVVASVLVDEVPVNMPPPPPPPVTLLAGEQQALSQQRPHIRAIQRLSSESVHRSTQSSSTRSTSSQGGHGGSSPSDGSDVLAARRDELVTQLLSGDSAESSQRTSTASSSPTAETTLEVHVINPTPPTTTVPLTADALRFAAVQTAQTAGEGRPPTPHRRSLSSSSSSNRPSEDAAAHAWDSVVGSSFLIAAQGRLDVIRLHADHAQWPAANASHRVNYPPETSSTRFPSAPMSPYVTPSFSPAVIQASASASRRLSSNSPPPFETPLTERPGSVGGQSSLSSTSVAHRMLPQGGGGGGQRYNTPLDAQLLNPPRSPRPTLGALNSDGAALPSSPGGLGRTRAISITSSPGPSRAVLGASPPITSILTPSGRPRGERSGSFINQFPELAPPFISRRELSIRSPPPITRRLSETAVIRRPDVPSPLLSTPPLHHGELEPPRIDMSGVANIIAPTPTLRPDGPRRARSAQEVPHGVACRELAAPALISLPAPPPSTLPTDVSPAADGESDTPRRRQSDDRPNDSRTGFTDELVFEMDEYAIADDEDDDESATPTRPTPNHDIPSLSYNALFPSGSPPPPTSVWTEATVMPGGLVDEGDLLPTNVEVLHDMDVTFDDEGLNTLERIFLLSRSEYAFHRAYVARVLGDLLGDVDPCESVEYVLPLISAFSLDEDDTVKEAFAADLHRILWYFFTVSRSSSDILENPTGRRPDDHSQTCLLVDNTDGSEQPMPDGEVYDTHTTGPSPLPETVNQLEHHHSAPIDLPTTQRVPDGQVFGSSPSRDSINSSSTHYGTSSSATHGMDTPLTSVSMSGTSGEEAFQQFVEEEDDAQFDEDCADEADKVWNEPGGAVEHDDTDSSHVVGAPVLHVGFFRPLLGTMLLSHNPQVANPTRDGIIALVARLRCHGPITVETWGSTAETCQTRQTFLSQTGPHEHDPLSFDDDARLLVEQEILYGIVLGMGMLSTDVADHIMDGTVEILREDGQEYDLQLQLEQEATLGRALSLSLIGSMSEFYSPEEVVHYGFVDEVIRGLDGDVSTRAEAALAMGNVAKGATLDQLDRLLGVFDQFANDPDPQVRQSVCVALPALCKRIPDERHRRDFAVSVMTAFVADVEDVRCAALEVLGEVIYTFVKDSRGPPMKLLEIYLNDKDSTGADCDWDILASFNFPGVCLTLGPDRWDEIRNLFHRLVDRAGDRVLRTIAAFLHELANILRPEQVAEDVLPVYRRCLESTDIVRGRIFEHVDVVIAHLPLPVAWECFCQLQEMWDNDTLGGWRAREQIALHIPSFLETFRSQDEVVGVVDMAKKALLDRFAAVRDAATYGVPLSYEILGRSHCSQSKMCELLLDLSLSSAYRQRLT